MTDVMTVAELRAIANARARPHREQAAAWLAIADRFTLNCQFGKANYWHEIKRQKEKDAEAIADFVMRAYR